MRLIEDAMKAKGHMLIYNVDMQLEFTVKNLPNMLLLGDAMKAKEHM